MALKVLLGVWCVWQGIIHLDWALYYQRLDYLREAFARRCPPPWPIEGKLYFIGTKLNNTYIDSDPPKVTKTWLLGSYALNLIFRISRFVGLSTLVEAFCCVLKCKCMAEKQSIRFPSSNTLRLCMCMHTYVQCCIAISLMALMAFISVTI